MPVNLAMLRARRQPLDAGGGCICAQDDSNGHDGLPIGAAITAMAGHQHRTTGSTASFRVNKQLMNLP